MMQHSPRRTNDIFRALVENSLDVMSLINADGTVVYVSPSVERIVGFRPDELIGKNVLELIHPDDLPVIKAVINERMESPGIPRLVEFRHLHKDGSWRNIEAVGKSFSDDPAVVGIIISSRDVTERKRMEARMQIASAALDATANGVAITDREGTIQWVNLAYSLITGFGADEVIGKNPRILKSGRYPPAFYQNLWDTILAGRVWRGEIVNRRKDGTLYTLEQTITPVRSKEGEITHFVAVQQDVTQQKETESDLAEREEQYRMLFQSSPAGLIVADSEGNIISVNDTFLMIAGYTREDLLNIGNIKEFYVNPDDGFTMLEEANKEGSLHAYPVLFKRKDGTSFEALLSLTLIRVGGRYCWQAMVQDNTERRQAEQRLRHLDKMEALGRLAAGIVHDFNDLLTAISGYSQLAMQQVSQDHPVQQDLQHVAEAVKRANILAKNLLNFSRSQQLLPRAVNLNGLLAGMAGLLRASVHHGVELATELDPDLGLVNIDPQQMEHTVTNLVINASDATPDGGRITLGTCNVNLNKPSSHLHGQTPPGSYVVLSVADTGTGMNKEVLPHIFEPFFTTKSEGQGTGLGLSSVYGIVKQSNGYIQVASELNRGTVVKIYLPRFLEAESAAISAEDVKPFKILVVDDDPTVVRVLKEFLEQKGHKILTASNGMEAIEQVRTENPKLVLLDIYMPGSTGLQVLQEIKAYDKNIAVIMITAETDEAVGRTALQMGAFDYIIKPFDLAHVENVLWWKLRLMD